MVEAVDGRLRAELPRVRAGANAGFDARLLSAWAGVVDLVLRRLSEVSVTDLACGGE
jgi:hypothetical protein